MVNEFGLNFRQQAFVDYYLKTGLITESAKKAGYKEKTAFSQGSTLLKNPKIRKALATRIEQMKSERIAEAREVLEFLTSVMRGEYDDEIVMNIGKGQGITQAEKVQTRVSSKDRIRAAEILAKINGMFINKSEVEFSGAIPIIIHDDI